MENKHFFLLKHIYLNLHVFYIF